MDEPRPSPEEAPRTADWAKGLLHQPRVRVGAIIAVALLAGIVVWVVASRGGSSSNTTQPTAQVIAPVAVSASGLASLAGSVGQPIYWAGPRKKDLYELHRTSNGNVYIRYLPPGTDAGAAGDYLTVATYPFKGAFRALNNVTDAQHLSIPGGGIALIAPHYKKSIHLAFPNVNYQVEVYDPSAARVLQLVRTGQIRPV